MDRIPGTILASIVSRVLFQSGPISPFSTGNRFSPGNIILRYRAGMCFDDSTISVFVNSILRVNVRLSKKVLLLLTRFISLVFPERNAVAGEKVKSVSMAGEKEGSTSVHESVNNALHA